MFLREDDSQIGPAVCWIRPVVLRNLDLPAVPERPALGVRSYPLRLCFRCWKANSGAVGGWWTISIAEINQFSRKSRPLFLGHAGPQALPCNERWWLKLGLPRGGVASLAENAAVLRAHAGVASGFQPGHREQKSRAMEMERLRLSNRRRKKRRAKGDFT